MTIEYSSANYVRHVAGLDIRTMRRKLMWMVVRSTIAWESDYDACRARYVPPMIYPNYTRSNEAKYRRGE